MLLALLFGVLTATADTQGWYEISRAEGITIYRRDDEKTGLRAYRGEGVVNAPIGRVLTLLRDVAGRVKWADRLKKAEIVRELSPLERIEYMQAVAPWPVKQRDIVIRSKIEIDVARQTIRLEAHSVEDPARPEDKNFVRAWIYSGDAELKVEDGGRKTRVTAELHADPRGSIPKWVVNLVQRSAPRKSIVKMMEILAKGGIPEDPLAAPLLLFNKHN